MVQVQGLDLNVAAPQMQKTFVIGAGFGRTGTSSMQIALAKLGWRSYHMREFFKNGKRAYTATIKVGNLKRNLREKVEDYDPAFAKFDECVVSKDAFDWNEIFDDPEHGKYNAVCTL